MARGKQGGNGDEGDDALADVHSIADRAAAGDELTDDEVQQLFPDGVLEGDGKTLKTLIKANLPVEVTVSMRAAEVPMRGGLPDPDSLKRVMATCEVAKYEPIPVREDQDGERKIVGWKIRAVLRPTFVEPVEDAASAATG